MCFYLSRSLCACTPRSQAAQIRHAATTAWRRRNIAPCRLILLLSTAIHAAPSSLRCHCCAWHQPPSSTRSANVAAATPLGHTCRRAPPGGIPECSPAARYAPNPLFITHLHAGRPHSLQGLEPGAHQAQVACSAVQRPAFSLCHCPVTDPRAAAAPCMRAHVAGGAHPLLATALCPHGRRQSSNLDSL